MKIQLILFFFVLYILVNCIPVLAAETRGIYASIPDQTTNKNERVKLYNKAYAVIIGIDRYKNLKPNKQLKNAVKDAKGIKETLSNNFSFEHIYTLYNENATHDNIRLLLLEELPKSIGKEDALFLFWAGHGNKKTTGAGDLGYLIPYDGNSDGIYGNITMDEIKNVISRAIPAKHIFYAFDACYSGLMTTRSGDKEVNPDLAYLKEITKEQVRQVITAGSKEQETMDVGPKGHSSFTGRLIEVLEEANNYITVNQIQSKIGTKVYQDAKAWGHVQIPSYDVIYGSGDFVFVPDIEKKEKNNQTELDRTEAERRRLKKQETEERDQSAHQRETEQKRKAAEVRIKAEQLGRLQLAEEQRMAALKSNQEKLAMQRAEVDKIKKSLKGSSDSIQGAVAEIKKLKDQITGMETTFAGFRQETNTRYDQMIKALDSEKRDEFEKVQEFKARIIKEKEQAENKRRDELTQLDTSFKSETAPLRGEIKRLSEKDFTLSTSAITLELGLYDVEKERLPVTLNSSAQSNVKIDINSSIPLPPSLARTFKQQWKSGFVRPEIRVHSNGDIMRVAIANDADNYQMLYEQGEFLSIAEKKKRQEEEKCRQAEQERKAEEIKNRLTSLGIEMVFVKGGCFQMGGTIPLVSKMDYTESSFYCDSHDATPIHEVCIDDFVIGKYEVTQELWKKIMGINPSELSSNCKKCPIDNVSWFDAQEFIEKLNRATGARFRLPTEAEWEYSCRSGGKAERYCGGNSMDAVAWHEYNGDNRTHPVGLKKPNGLGIYDMSGNVFEWVNDVRADYPSERQKNPTGPTSGGPRVIRGGSSASRISEINSVEAVCRTSDTDDHRHPFNGFRLAASAGSGFIFKEIKHGKTAQIKKLRKNNMQKVKTVQQEADLKEKLQPVCHGPTAVDWFNKADALWNGGKCSDSNKASEYLSEAIRLDPKYAKAYSRRGEAYFDRKLYILSIEDLNQAISLDPKDASSYKIRGVTYNTLNEYTTAIKDFNKALSLEPKDASSCNNRGFAYYHLNDYTHAIEDFDKAISFDPNFASAYSNRGAVYNDRKEYTRAIKDLSQAISYNPKDAMAYQNRGIAYNKLAEYKSAIEDLTKAINFLPRNKFAYANRGLAYYYLKEYKLAITDFEMGKYDDALRAWAYQLTGDAYTNLEEYKTAIDNYISAIAFDSRLATDIKKGCERLKEACSLGKCGNARLSELCQ